MARIDFYVLPSASQEARFTLTAKLCQKALGQQLNTLIWLNDHTSAALLDEQLWQFKPETFLPHAIISPAEPAPPILLSASLDHPTYSDYLIQLSEQPHPEWSRFARLAEIVIQTPEVLASTRQRYRQYQAQGHDIHMHNM